MMMERVMQMSTSKLEELLCQHQDFRDAILDSLSDG